MFPASAYTGIVKRGIQKTIWQRRRGNIVTKPGILLLSMALVSCMLLTACADSSASPARAKDRISRNHPARRAEAPQLRQPKSGNAGSLRSENNPVLEGWGNKIVRIRQ